VAPSGDAYAALDDAVASPTVPTLTDYVTRTSTGNIAVTLGADIPDPLEISVTRVWLYAKTTTAAATVTVTLGAADAVEITIPVTTEGWASVDVPGLEPADINEQELVITYTKGSSAAIFVYAAYVEVLTPGSANRPQRMSLSLSSLRI
jgi:hypothetical protein